MRQASIEKGTLCLTIANLLFFAIGYAIYFALSRMLGSAAEFGNYGVVISIASLISTVLVAGMQQTVSKFVSEMPGSAEAVKRTALRMQFMISGTVFVLYFLSAPLIAMLLNDPSLAPLLRLSSPIILFHPLFSVFLGYLNGLRRFMRQARLYATYQVLRLALILALVALGFGVFGAVGGFVAASFLGMGIGYALSRSKPVAHAVPVRKLLNFCAPLILFAVALNAVQHIDIYFLKSLLPAAVAPTLTGYYVAAHLVASIPYMVAYSLTFVLFPLVSGTMFRNDIEKARFYISSALRYCTLVVVPLTLFIVASPAPILALLYPGDYAAASSALAVLTLGSGFFAWFYLLATAIAASGRPKVVSWLGFAALITSALLCLFLVPAYMMLGAAIASASAMVLSALLAAAYVYRKFHALISPLSLLRILLAGILTALALAPFPATGPMLMPKFAAFAALYLALLWAFREFRPADLSVVLNMLR